MKKNFLILFVVLLFISTNVFAGVALGLIDGVVGIVSATKEVADAAEFDFKADISEKLASQLEGKPIVDVYDRYKVNTLGPVFGNLVIGFGVGSNWQGDKKTATKQKFADSIVWGVAGGVAISCLGLELILAVPFSASGQSTGLMEIALYSLIGGASISLLVRSIGVIKSCNYAKKYNKELQNQLDIAAIPGPDGSLSVLGKISVD